MKKNSIKRKLLFIVISILVTITIGIIIYFNFYIPPYITKIEKNSSKRYVDKIIFNIEVENYFIKLNKTTWCLLLEKDQEFDVNSADWQKAVNGYCSFTVKDGDYKVYVKDDYNNVNDFENQKVIINRVVAVNAKKNIFYLYKGQEDKIEYDLTTIGKVDENVKFSSSDVSIVDVDDNGKIVGKNHGTAIITLTSKDDTKAEVKVVVSKFINKPGIDSSKNYIECKQFSKEEADLIDNILFDRIDKAGYKTRAGVVAAARFLTVDFSYRIHYFYENGRLNNYAPYYHVDGEGRYYHRGLYLHTSKYSDISAKFVGPSIWGCKLQNYTDWGPYVTGKYYPNGLDCSGFVSWALLNGGFDVGDIGAGANDDHNDLDDLGEKVYITDELMNSGRVKVGDLIGLNGHMAILAGWDENNYYIAESLNTTGGVVMTTVARNNLVHNSIYRYIILMDNVYHEDGNLTNIW